MPADTLLDMALRACARYSARITDIGDLDYDLIRPVLLKIESPERLHQLELASPQIIGHSAELWLNFLKRDIPDYQLKRHEPKDPRNWYKVYRKLKAEAQQDSMDSEAQLKAALAGIKKEKEHNVATLATSTGSLPGPGRRAVMHYNYNSGKAGSKGAHKMTLMERIRKEARDASSSRMSRPMHELHKRATAVTRAPVSFVEDVKRKKVDMARSPPPLPSTVAKGTGRRVSRPPLHAPPRPPRRPAVADEYDLTLDREARLRALKAAGLPAPDHTGSASTGQPPSRAKRKAEDLALTADFLEDSDDDDDDGQVELPKKLLKPEGNLQRGVSPRRLSPLTHGVKQKDPPSMFMSPGKKNGGR